MIVGDRSYKQASCRIAVTDAVPEDMREGMREVLSLKSDQPGKGHAKALMHQVCQEADVAGTVLILQPIPFGDGLDAEKLERFYGRFGFTTVQREPAVLMARQPVVRAPLRKLEIARG